MLQSTKTYDAERPASPQPLASWYAQGLSDGLGDRVLMFDNTHAPSLELLRFRQDLAELPGFETALREQIRRLARFQHPAFARVRSVQRIEPDDDLALISNHTAGTRLSEVLRRAHGPGLAATLIRELAPALAELQQHAGGGAHGLLNPDRIIVAPDGRLTIVEHVIGPAIDALDLRIDRLASMGIALPPVHDRPFVRLDAATDWYQLGLVAVAVLLGRPVTPADLPHLERVLDQVGEAAGRDGTPLSPFVRQWLDRTLQIAGNRIDSDADARAALDELLRKEQSRDVRRLQAVPPPPPRDRQVASPPPVTPAAPPALTAVPARPPAAAPTPPMAAARGPQSSAAVASRPSGGLLSDQGPFAAFEREAQAGKQLLLDIERRAALRDDAAVATASVAAERPQRTRRAALPAALTTVIVAQAIAIALLARAVWLAPATPMVLETDASGGNVVVTSRQTAADPLQLAVAPDLGWVRVTSPSTEASAAGAAGQGSAGVLRVSSPIAFTVVEGEQTLGSVPGADIRLPAGRHEIEFVNAALGYRSRQVLHVEAGQTLSVHVAPPRGLVTIDASPWAEVAVDGRAIGRTPIGPLPLMPGEHQFTFSHPSGGTDTQRVLVKSADTVRVIGKLRY